MIAVIGKGSGVVLQHWSGKVGGRLQASPDKEASKRDTSYLWLVIRMTFGSSYSLLYIPE